MGCGASHVAPWESTVTEGFTSFPLTRTCVSGGGYDLRVDETTLAIGVEPYKTKNGYVSVKSFNPFAVAFETPTCRIAYVMGKKKAKSIVCNDSMVYVRRTGAGREVGPSDTTWRLAVKPPVLGGVVQPDGTPAIATAMPVAEHWSDPAVPLELPRTISVVNANGRVLVWQGERPASASEAAARAPTDLLARVGSAVHGVDITADGTMRYVLEVKESLASRAQAAGNAAELPLFMAIALEAFWSQGARCHSFAELGIRASSVDTEGADVRPNSSVMRDAFAGRSKMLPASE